MGKTKIILLLIWLPLVSAGSAYTDRQRQSLQATFRAELGVTEVGVNAGKRVEQYQRTAFTKPPAPWCACFVVWCFLQVCVEAPRSALAADFFRDKKRIIYTSASGETGIVKVGDVAGIYFPKLKGIHHILFIDEWNTDDESAILISGNSNDSGSREGIKVCRKVYQKEDIAAIADYIE